MKIYVKIEGITPILFNRFCEEEYMLKSPKNKNLLPREEAEKTLYKNKAAIIYIPAINIFSCIISAGIYHKLGKNKVTTQKSSLIPAGLQVMEIECSLNTSDFEVDSRSVVVPATGGRIMKHRARLDEWETEFHLIIDETIFDERFVRQLIDDAGMKCGLGDFRPNRKGLFGKFKVTEWKALKVKK